MSPFLHPRLDNSMPDNAPAFVLEFGADSPVDFVPRFVAFEANARNYAACSIVYKVPRYNV